MFNKTISIPFTEYAAIKAICPTASFSDVELIVNGRAFIRWYQRNKKAINIILIAVPTFAMAMYGLHAGSFALNLFTHSIPVFTHSAPVTPLSPIAPMSSTVAVMAAAGATGAAGFFSGKGVILLHMLLVGFFTLVVCSFLKFTGRGDMIPLVAFVGGAIILYEVIGLFNDIYMAIKTLMSM